MMDHNKSLNSEKTHRKCTLSTSCSSILYLILFLHSHFTECTHYFEKAITITIIKKWKAQNEKEEENCSKSYVVSFVFFMRKKAIFNKALLFFACICVRMRLNGWISEEWKKKYEFLDEWNEKYCAFFSVTLNKTTLNVVLLFCKIWNMRVLCWTYRTCMDVICPTRNECWKQQFSRAIYMGQFSKEEKKASFSYHR